MTVVQRDEDIRRLVVEARIKQPALPHQVLQSRARLDSWQGKPLVLVAADHPARRTVAAGGQPFAMANRADLLRRLSRLLMQPFVDGVLATPDIMEELAILQHWVHDRGGPDFLSGKVLIGSMNRAGLSETVFEMDDFVTGYDPAHLTSSRLDAAKLLLRVDTEAPESGKTLGYVADALRELSLLNLPVFVEPIPVPLSVDNLVRLMGVASALGPTSRGRWLKVPMVADFDRVAAATTCPLVLLGGADAGASKDIIANVQRCLQAGSNVRGVLMGRGVLYPPDGGDSRQSMRTLAEVLTGTTAKEVVTWDGL